MATPRSAWLISIPIALVALAMLAWALFPRVPPSVEQRQREVRPAPAPPAARESIPPPVVIETAPPPRRQGKAAVTSEEQAIEVLHAHISARGEVSADCLVLLSEGLRNDGYNISARDRCAGKSAGRWRIEARTGKVRYLNP